VNGFCFPAENKVLQMVRIFIRLMAGFLATGFMSTTALGQSGDAEVGKRTSVTCVACHGQNGVSVSDDFPHIAGQVPGYVASQLAKFKSGEPTA